MPVNSIVMTNAVCRASRAEGLHSVKLLDMGRKHAFFGLGCRLRDDQDTAVSRHP